MRLPRVMVAYWLLAPWLLFGACSARGQAAAPAACPWLTAGTAARVLGGDVTLAAATTDSDEGTCTFSRVAEPATSLKIEVRRSVLAVCGANGMKIRGIGNEAMRCSLAPLDGRARVAIEARVRDRYFRIAMSYLPGASGSKPDNPADDALEHAAESVAGNLF